MDFSLGIFLATNSAIRTSCECLWSLQSSELWMPYACTCPIAQFCKTNAIYCTHTVWGAWQQSHTTMEIEHDTQVCYGLWTPLALALTPLYLNLESFIIYKVLHPCSWSSSNTENCSHKIPNSDLLPPGAPEYMAFNPQWTPLHSCIYRNAMVYSKSQQLVHLHHKQEEVWNPLTLVDHFTTHSVTWTVSTWEAQCTQSQFFLG